MADDFLVLRTHLPERSGSYPKKSMKQEGHRLFLPRVLSQAPSMSGVGGLLDLEIVCDSKMPRMSFEFENISHQG